MATLKAKKSKYYLLLSLLSKFNFSSTTTSGRCISLAFIFKMYSPMNPMKNIWIPPNKNIPINNGAIPASKEYQLHSFNIKYIRAIMIQINDKILPNIVAK